MALEIYWSKRAEKQLDEILLFLQNEWGENVTKNFAKKIYNFLDLLSKYPKLGTIENKEKQIRGFPIVKQVNLFYKIDKGRIILLSFFDNRQNPQKRKF
ncbi:MAG TPA: type II toxin-antitoxin system RelE/ParE family toxin [Tangfeifania sp.]|nr:type II toxin-antitoxin system RelE/ParE family toxin [Tangfeifania sp.]